MYVHSRKLSTAFKFFIATLGTIALMYSVGLFQGQISMRFFYMFTNLSNLAVVAYFWAAAIRSVRHPEAGQAPWHPKLKHALMLAITVTWLVSHFLLNGGKVFSDGYFRPDMLVVHYLVPMSTILDWLLFDEKGTMGFAEPLTWTIFPLCYVAYIFTIVLGLGVNVNAELPANTSRFPYPFLDIDVLGIDGVTGMVCILTLAFLAIGFFYVAVDKRLARRA